MTFSLILITFLTFLFFVLLHVILHRTLNVKSQIKLILTIFLIVPLAIFISAIMINMYQQIFSVFELVAALLMFLALSSAYIQTYPACQTFAPTLKIVYELGKAGNNGLTENNIVAFFPVKSVLDDSIDSLVDEEFIIVKDDYLSLTSKGKLMASGFYLLRKIYGLDKGEG